MPSYLPIPTLTPEDAFKPYKRLVEMFDQAQPMIMWASKSGITQVAFAPPGEEAEDLSLAEMLAGSVEQIRAELGAPYWVMVSCEAWVSATLTPEEVANHRHGDLGRKVKAGDESVIEAVCIVMVATDKAWFYQVPFKREKHRVRWSEPVLADSVGGGVADVLLHVVRRPVLN